MTFKTREEYETWKAAGAPISPTLAQQVDPWLENLPPRTILGFTGSGLLLLGAFAPLLHAPMVGAVSYILDGRGDGWFIIAAGTVAALLVILERCEYLWLPGVAAGGLMTWTFINLQSRLATMRHDLKGNPFAGLATVSLGYGWFVLALGVLCLLAASRKKS